MTQPALPIDALLVGPVALLPDGRTRSGIRKTPTADALWLSSTGLQGDAQADLRIHGGVEKAVHHYPREHYAVSRACLACSHSRRLSGQSICM